MLSVKDLQLGYSDALNYTQRQNKNMFNEVFVRNTFLDELTKQSSFFLIGEKGTGKTAYATYLCNNNYKDISANLLTSVNSLNKKLLPGAVKHPATLINRQHGLSAESHRNSSSEIINRHQKMAGTVEIQ